MMPEIVISGKMIRCPYCGQEYRIGVASNLEHTEVSICPYCNGEFGFSIEVKVKTFIPDLIIHDLEREFHGKTIKCQVCRTGQMQFWGFSGAFGCSNYGRGCSETMNVVKARELLSRGSS